MILQQKGYAVMWAPTVVDKRTDLTNGEVITSMAVFPNIKEARKWRDEKHCGKHKKNEMIKQVIIVWE